VERASTTGRARRPVNPDARRYRLLAWLLRFTAVARRSSGILFAFVSGVWVNAASDPSVTSFPDLLARIYDVTDRGLAWMAVAPTVVLLLLPLLRLVLRFSLRRVSFAVALSEALQQNVDESLGTASRGRIAWGSQLVLQSCPHIEEGWAPQEIELSRSPSLFHFAGAESPEFHRWVGDEANKYVRDGRSLRLMEEPTSFTDDRTLRLRVQPTRFSDVMFYSRVCAAEPLERSVQLSKVPAPSSRPSRCGPSAPAA
jgi:hypothetical protein